MAIAKNFLRNRALSNYCAASIPDVLSAVAEPSAVMDECQASTDHNSTTLVCLWQKGGSDTRRGVGCWRRTETCRYSR